MAILDINKSTTVGNFDSAIKSLEEAKNKSTSKEESQKFDQLIQKYEQSRHKLISICKNDIIKHNMTVDQEAKKQVEAVMRDNFKALSMEKWNAIINDFNGVEKNHDNQIGTHNEHEMKAAGGDGFINFLEGKSGINLMTGVKAALSTAAVGALFSLDIGAFAGLWGLSLPAGAPATLSIIQFVPEIITGLATLNPVLGIAGAALLGIGAVALVKKIFGPEIKKMWTNFKVARKVNKATKAASDKLESDQDLTAALKEQKKLYDEQAEEQKKYRKPVYKANKDGSLVRGSDGELIVDHYENSHYENEFESKAKKLVGTKFTADDIKNLKEEYGKKGRVAEDRMVELIEGAFKKDFIKEVSKLATSKDATDTAKVDALKNKYKDVMSPASLEKVLVDNGLVQVDPNLGARADEVLKAAANQAYKGATGVTAYNEFKDAYDKLIRTMTGKKPIDLAAINKEIVKLDKYTDKSAFMAAATASGYQVPNSWTLTDDKAEKLALLCGGMKEVLVELAQELQLNNSISKSAVTKQQKAHGLTEEQLKDIGNVLNN